MPTRQYIGARYVPKFFDNAGSNDWIPGISYEPLTIVTYLNDSFTSKKPVPASVGAPNLNPDYWVLTGAFNSQLSDLSSQVSALDGIVGDLDSNLNGIKITVFDTVLDQVSGSNPKIAQKIILHAVLDPLGINAENSIIIGYNAFNHASNSWWSDDQYPGKYQEIKSLDFPLTVTSLAAGATTDTILGTELFDKQIIGYDIVWTSGNVFNVGVVKKSPNVYANITNTYTAAITDTGTLTVYYIDEAGQDLALACTDSIVTKIRTDSNGDPYIQIQSMLRSQYDIGDTVRIAVLTYTNYVTV